MKPADNERMCRVEGDAPMGRFLRENFWIPARLSESVKAGGAPLRVKLIGRNYIVWRSTDGRIGFFNEACPHRRASLALARNEDNALTCIFHGWKFGVTGEVLDVPTEPNFSVEFCKTVPLKHYHAREAGGAIWVWLGERSPAEFPDFEFLAVPIDQIYAFYQTADYNWVQSLEGFMDAAHVTVLHQSWLTSISKNGLLAAASGKLAPVYEFEERSYGFRYAAIRTLDNGQKHIRANEFAMPWYCFIAPPTSPTGDRSVSVSVPIDDYSTLCWTFRFNPHQALSPSIWNPVEDRTSWPPQCPGGPDEIWGQDRVAMANGSFSGFTGHLGQEDMAVAASQGRIANRSEEFLGSSDRAVMLVRRILLAAVNEYQEGKLPAVASGTETYSRARARSDVIAADSDWRLIDA